MKRALVDYSTSSESEIDEEHAPPPAKKIKKLPSLSSNLKPSVPQDDPSKHQGRVRTQPFVEGQFATHIYATISISALNDIIASAIADVRTTCKDLQVFSLLEPPKVDGDSGIAPDVEGKNTTLDEIHLSLSRPLFLQSHQRALVTRTVKDLARQTASHIGLPSPVRPAISDFPSFAASFASFAILNNDEGTRSFLVLEIGAGSSEFSDLSTGLKPLLKELRQPAYYESPRYHVSIAWILTTVPEAPRFPQNLTSTLETKYGEALRNIKLEVEEICTKIGKVTSRSKLAA